METPGERPPTRLRVMCQEGWDGARRHPQPAAGVQSAEQWCSSQSQPQPQLRYQHGSGTGHAALSSWPVADQNRRSRDFQQNQQLVAWQTDSQPQQRNGLTRITARKSSHDVTSMAGNAATAAPQNSCLINETRNTNGRGHHISCGGACTVVVSTYHFGPYKILLIFYCNKGGRGENIYCAIL